jgi:RNA recognition motif-containing protein
MSSDGGEDSTNKLWMGDLEPFMDEAFLTAVFAQFGYHVQSIRWIRNYQTGLVARYCFIEFNDSSAARQALESLNSQPIPGTNGVCLFFPYLMHLVLYVAISVKKVQTKLGKSQGRQWAIRLQCVCSRPFQRRDKPAAVGVLPAPLQVHQIC